MGLGIPNPIKAVKKVGGAVVDGAKKAGGAVKDGAEKAGGAVVDGAQKAGGVVADGAQKVGGVAKDAVHISKEAAGEVAQQGKNFAGGVGEWGKDLYDTGKAIAKDPGAAAKGIGKLGLDAATLSVPGVAEGRALIQGDNPLEVRKDAANGFIDVGKGVYEDFKDAKEKHGWAGALGYAAPDIVAGVLSGGAATGAKTGIKEGIKAGVKQGVKAGVKEAGQEIAEKATTKAGREEVLKSIPTSPIPDPRTPHGATNLTGDGQEQVQQEPEDHIGNLINGIQGWFS